MFRDIRDNFIADMWIENGYGNQPSLFTKTETPVSVILLLLMGSMILVRNNLLYTTYIPFNCIFFERLIATFKHPGNVGFLIYVADSFGYLGSVVVLFAKEIFKVKLRWSSFYSQGVVALSILGIGGTILSLIYFTMKFKKTIPENV